MIAAIKSYTSMIITVAVLAMAAAIKVLSSKTKALTKKNKQQRDEIDDLYSAHEAANKELIAAQHAARVTRNAARLSEHDIDERLRMHASHSRNE